MKRILLLVNKKKRIEKENKTICVVGVSHKAGVTHLSLCLANFIHSVLGQKVIYIELRNDSKLLSVVGMKQVDIGEVKGYEFMGVKYVLSDDIDAIKRLLYTEKTWFIIDLESLNEETQDIFINSNNKIVIGSLSPWCKREYYEFIEKNKLSKYNTNQMIYIVSNKTKKTLNEFKTLYKCSTTDLPIINDPFSLKEENFEVLINLIR